MPIDQRALLSLLAQLQSGGAFPITPVSGLGGGAPLSGLPLGEQGVGLGGGGSLLGGGGGLGAGTEGPGLDLLSLLNTVSQGEGSGANQNLLAGIGGGIPFGPGHGAGGQLLAYQPPSGFPQGAQGQLQPSAQIFGTLKELLGLGKGLATAFGGGGSFAARPESAYQLYRQGERGDPGTVPEAFVLPSMPSDVATAMTGAMPTAAHAGFSASGAIAPTLEEAGMTAAGPAEALGPAGAPALAGELGPAGEAFAPLVASELSLPSLSSLLGVLGLATNIGGGAYSLAQGHIAPGAGALGGTALGALLGSIIPGIGTLLGASLGGAAGGLLGGLLGGPPGVHDLKQQLAGQVSAQDLAGMAGAQSQALAGQISPLQALQFLSGDISSIPGRNPVRTELLMPLAVAQQLGFPTVAPGELPGQMQALGGGVSQYGTNIGAPWTNMIKAPWSALTPDTFQKFLSLYAKDPTDFGGYILGSGDVAYASQAQAEATAAQAKVQTQQFLTDLIKQMGLG